MTEISDEVVAAAQLADAEWNRTRKRDGRSWGSVPPDQVRRLIAAAVVAERERIRSLAVEHEAEYLVRRTASGARRYDLFAGLIDGGDHAGAERAKAERILAAIFACGSADCPKPFALYRSEDVTGVSGSGTVAHGAQFADGTVVIRWLGKHASTVVWASLDAAVNVHGHDGRTRVVWLAADFSEMALAESEAATAERERIRQLAAKHSATYDERSPCNCGRPDCTALVRSRVPFTDLITDPPEGTPRHEDHH